MDKLLSYSLDNNGATALMLNETGEHPTPPDDRNGWTVKKKEKVGNVYHFTWFLKK